MKNIVFCFYLITVFSVNMAEPGVLLRRDSSMCSTKAENSISSNCGFSVRGSRYAGGDTTIIKTMHNLDGSSVGREITQNALGIVIADRTFVYTKDGNILEKR